MFKSCLPTPFGSAHTWGVGQRAWKNGQWMRMVMASSSKFIQLCIAQVIVPKGGNGDWKPVSKYGVCEPKYSACLKMSVLYFYSIEQKIPVNALLKWMGNSSQDLVTLNHFCNCVAIFVAVFPRREALLP